MVLTLEVPEFSSVVRMARIELLCFIVEALLEEPGVLEVAVVLRGGGSDKLCEGVGGVGIVPDGVGRFCVGMWVFTFCLPNSSFRRLNTPSMQRLS